MSLLYDSPSWIYYSLLVVIPTALFFVAVLWFVRKIVSAETLRKNHDVAGFTFGSIGVLYSVILGFTVINVQTHYNEAGETIQTEATMLADLYRDADYFDTETSNAIRSSLRKYIEYVILEEWSLNKQVLRRLHADDILQQIWNSYRNVDLTTDRVRIWYKQAISKLDNLMNARLSREFYATEHLSSMMWSLLILGGVITTCFMFFFGLENIRMQMLMTALLAGYLSFMLYLVFSLDHIFEGPQRIRPTALEQTLVLFDRWDQRA